MSDSLHHALNNLTDELKKRRRGYDDTSGFNETHEDTSSSHPEERISPPEPEYSSDRDPSPEPPGDSGECNDSGDSGDSSSCDSTRQTSHFQALSSTLNSLLGDTLDGSIAEDLHESEILGDLRSLQDRLFGEGASSLSLDEQIADLQTDRDWHQDHEIYDHRDFSSPIDQPFSESFDHELPDPFQDESHHDSYHHESYDESHDHSSEHFHDGHIEQTENFWVDHLDHDDVSDLSDYDDHDDSYIDV